MQADFSNGIKSCTHISSVFSAPIPISAASAAISHAQKGDAKQLSLFLSCKKGA